MSEKLGADNIYPRYYKAVKEYELAGASESEARKQTSDSIIRQEALLQYAAEHHLTVSEKMLKKRMMILGFGSSSYNTPEGCPRAPLKKAANMILVILLCLLLTAAAVTAVYFRDPLTEGAATDKVSSHMTMHMNVRYE